MNNAYKNAIHFRNTQNDSWIHYMKTSAELEKHDDEKEIC